MSIFRCLMPQTAATIQQRAAALELLAEKKLRGRLASLCIDQFQKLRWIGSLNSCRRPSSKAGADDRRDPERSRGCYDD